MTIDRRGSGFQVHAGSAGHNVQKLTMSTDRPARLSGKERRRHIIELIKRLSKKPQTPQARQERGEWDIAGRDEICGTRATNRKSADRSGQLETTE